MSTTPRSSGPCPPVRKEYDVGHIEVGAHEPGRRANEIVPVEKARDLHRGDRLLELLVSILLLTRPVVCITMDAPHSHRPSPAPITRLTRRSGRMSSLTTHRTKSAARDATSPSAARRPYTTPAT